MAKRKGGKGKSFVVTGDEALDRALHALPGAVQKKVLRQAMRKALKPVQAAVKQEAPVLTGLTKKSVKVRAGKAKRGSVRLGVVIGEGDYVGKTFYAAFLEYGHHTASRKSRKLNPKSESSANMVPPSRFMGRAYDRTKESAKGEAMGLIRDGVEREAAALAKGAD